MVAFPGMRGITQNLWAIPPRGLSIARFKVGPDERMQWTYLCEKEDCFAMATSTESEQAARDYVRPHICPAPPRRGVTATGKSLLEKMWDESDDALDAYKANQEYLGMEGDILRGYIHGIAECITFCSSPYFKIVEDVLRQMQKRWRMRMEEVPFSPTPGYRFNPRPSSTNFPVFQSVEDYHSPGADPVVSDVTPSPARKTSRRPPAQAPAPAVAPREFTLDEVTMIRNTLHAGISSAEDIAKIFDVTPGRILAVAGPPPKEETGNEPEVNDFLGGLFA